MTGEQLRFAVLQGLVARCLSKKMPRANPYGLPGRQKAGTEECAKAMLWAWGRRGMPKARRATVSRGTDPRGDTWKPRELGLLRVAGDHFKDSELGGMLGRSPDAVRTQLSRIRKAGAA